MKLYCVRDKRTGKLVSNITNPRHKFWEMKAMAANAAKCPHKKFNGTANDLEVVEFECTEIKND